MYVNTSKIHEMIYMSTHQNVINNVQRNKRSADTHATCNVAATVRYGWTEGQDTALQATNSAADGPGENSGCSLGSWCTARINVQEWAQRVTQVPPRATS